MHETTCLLESLASLNYLNFPGPASLLPPRGAGTFQQAKAASSGRVRQLRLHESRDQQHQVPPTQYVNMTTGISTHVTMAKSVIKIYLIERKERKLYNEVLHD